jgi:hypothetical protein
VKMSQDLWAAWAGVIQVFSGYFERVSTVRVPLHQRSEVLHALTSYHIYGLPLRRQEVAILQSVASSALSPSPLRTTITIKYSARIFLSAKFDFSGRSTSQKKLAAE